VTIIAASARVDVANYLGDVVEVYIAIIFIYVLLNMAFSFGLRPPYSRYTDAVLGFLRDVSEPYLRIFRRVIPPIGMVDLSPMIAIIVLILLRTVVVGAIHG
jgi:YggT family protein